MKRLIRFLRKLFMFDFGCAHDWYSETVYVNGKPSRFLEACRKCGRTSLLAADPEPRKRIANRIKHFNATGEVLADNSVYMVIEWEA